MTPKIRPSWLVGITTVGNAWLTTANPSAIRFAQVNADNSISYLTDTQFRIAIGAGTGSGSIEGSVGPVDNRIVRSSGASGIEVSGSSVSLDDSGNLTTAGSIQGLISIYPPANLGPGSIFQITNPNGNDLQVIYTTGGVVRVSIPDSGDIELNDFVVTDGLQSSDDISSAGVLQAGSINTLAYSRLGTGTTSHALNGPEDILVSGDAEVNGTLFTDGDLTVAGVTSLQTLSATAGTFTSIGVSGTVGVNSIAFPDSGFSGILDVTTLTGPRTYTLQNASGTIAYIPIVTPVSPLTGATVSSTVTREDQTHYITPAGTLATLTVTLPASASSRVGQIIRVFISQIIAALTVNVSGAGSVVGITPDTSSANSTFAYQCVSTSGAGTWAAITLQ